MKKIFTSLLVLVAFMFLVPFVHASELTENLTLESDSTECYVIPTDSNITIDLNGHNITCTGTDAIYVNHDATLTMKGEGVVQSITSGKAAIFNNGTVTLNGGTYSANVETTKYYTILNHGNMTIKNGVTVEQTGYVSTTASLIDNGYYSFGNTSNERLGYKEGNALRTPTLIINGGEFNGGMNTVKNDDNGVLEITGGHFVNNIQVAVMNWNVATITGGVFEVPTGLDKTTLFVASDGPDSVNKGVFVINGGTFKGEYMLEFMSGYVANANVRITDGVFAYTKGFVNPMDQNGASTRPSWNDVGTKEISGGVFSDNTITPSEGYDLVQINQDNNNDGVNDYLVSAVQLSTPIEVNLTINETYNTELPNDVIKYGTWALTDTTVASVENGIITGRKKGNTTLKVKFGTEIKTYNITVSGAKVEKPTVSGTYTYNGEEQEVVINGFDEELMEVTNNTGTLANDYVAHVSLKDTNNYEWADGTNTTLDLAWSISKAKVNAPTMTTTSYTFTGENVTPEVTGYDETLMTVSGDTEKVDVGEYEIVYSLKDTNNYEWADGTTEDVKLAWNIGKTKVNLPTLEVNEFEYTASAVTPTATGFSPLLMTMSGDVEGTTVGNYELVIALKDKENYEWANGGVEDVKLAWSITKAKVNIPTLSKTTYTFTGETITPELTGYNETLMTVSGNNAKVETGEYELVVSLKDVANYEWSNGKTEDVKFAWSITKATLVKPTLVKTTYNYTGEEITPELEGFDEATMTKGGIYLGSPVGEYTIKISIKDKNKYTWADGTTDDVQFKWYISFGVPVLSATSTYDMVKLSWTKVDGSQGYQVYRCNSEGASCTKLTTTTELTYKDKKLKFNKKYYYKVRAYKKVDGVNQYGKYSSLLGKKTALTAPTVTASKNRYRNVLIEWKKVSGAQRYYVYRCNSEGEECKNIGFAYDLDLVNTNGKEGKTYIYKVRAYRDGVYGPYSEGTEGLRLDDTITYKVKNTSYKKNTITIENVETATKYVIYRATSKNGKYKKIKTIASTGQTIVYKDKDVSFNKKYYYKVRINNGVNDSDYSEIKSVTTNRVGIPEFTIESEMSYATITIGKTGGATGYQIIYSTDNEEYETLVKTTSLTYDKKFNDGKYYIKIRAYRKVGSKYYYGSYSSAQELVIATEK